MTARPFCLLFIIAVLTLCAPSLRAAERFVSYADEGFVWLSAGRGCPLLVDACEDRGVLRAVSALQKDAAAVAGAAVEVCMSPSSPRVVVVGTIAPCRWLRQLLATGALAADSLLGKREKYILTTLRPPFAGVEEAVVIAGSDKRGAIYGIYELSAQMGVSPWYYWADVPIEQHARIAFRAGVYSDGEPAVRYRGIFLNDEWPSLGLWAQETFGGFNSSFYEKVFELLLRLRGNFLWPALWASAFYDDDPRNGPLADEMGIVMGTSHHEPMALAQQDWKRRGSGAWDYTTNGSALRAFWQTGLVRARDWEKVVTIGMRGDGDAALSAETNISLLQTIIADQRKIIEDVTGSAASATPQVWALYKEVQDYYDEGMRVPDDVTLLLCDDNWGNVRRLPALDAAPRQGGDMACIITSTMSVRRATLR